MLDRPLTDAEVAHFREHQYLVLTHALDTKELGAITGWTEDLSSWPETPGKWMKYFESTETESRMLCRVEDFVPYHPGYRELLLGQGLLHMLGQLMGEPAVLFKEKINFKLPGGSGFAAHQDAPAFTTFDQRYHITVMLAVDPSTQDNGCLEISDPVPPYQILGQTAGGTIDPELEAQMSWRPLEVPAGAVVFFDSYLPHRSQPNRTGLLQVGVTQHRLPQYLHIFRFWRLRCPAASR